MTEFTHGQEVTLDMMKMAAAEAKQAFEGLDRKAQELLGIGSLVLGLIGVGSAVSTGASDAPELRSGLIFVAISFFLFLVVAVLSTKQIHLVGVSPMRPSKVVAAEWSLLSGDELWAKLIVQYESVVTSYQAANAEKAKHIRRGSIALMAEVTLMVIALNLR